MLEAITRKWWVLLVRGCFGVLIGILAFARRPDRAVDRARVVGLYASAVGLLEIALSFRVRRLGLALERQVTPRPSAV